jgi:uncharacterized RDD family membrane protein YckC
MDEQPHQTPVSASPTLVKADLTKRFIAALIDGVIGGLLSYAVGSILPLVGGILGAAYILLKDGLELEFMDKRSLGKKLMKLRPVRLDGNAMDMNTSISRNWPLAIGSLVSIIPLLGLILGPLVGSIFGLIELILVVTDPEGRRLGDKMAGTKVIEVNE